MAKNVIIVESPSKAKTIERFLGKDYDVLSSVGHIRDIPTKKSADGKPPIDIEHGFEPTYEIDPEKKKIIADIKKAIKGAGKKVYLATDGDREGEAIAWHLTQVLGLDPKTTPRIVVHEITKPAIEEALSNPRTIDFDLVDAQQARRILDRLVGFELSPVVQRKIPGGRSAGRVQSPAVRLIVERENEIKAFKPEVSYKTTADFVLKTKDALPAELNTKFGAEDTARTFLEALKGATFTISDISTTPGTRNPNAPFTTSTLQQEAASRLGYSVKRTMTAAQRLYQDGKITYMRTDSVNLSPIALKAMGEYITKEYGAKYLQTRTYKTKSVNAQEAHEAIRPVDVRTTKASDDPTEQKLYDLIRRRTLASQMAPASLERTTITITISTRKELFEAKGEIVLFDGFLKVYGDIIKKEEVLLPKLTANEKIDLVQAVSKQIFSRPPARYTEGSLVKKLEELGIGRPSTYATIISTIQLREYVTKGISEGVERQYQQLMFKDGAVTETTEVENTGSDKGKLIPTPSGMIVNDFLNDHFDQIVDYDFTADVEEEFDKIADGKEKWQAMLKTFYGPFHKTIVAAGSLTRAETTKTRELGTDPKTGRPVSARFGRFGPMVQLGESEDEEKPHFASIPADLSIDTITLEQALGLLVLPRTVGKSQAGDDVIVSTGRFGPYARVGKETVSLKDLDPYTVDLETVLERLKEKEKLIAQRVIADFGKIQVLRGRFGPYVTDGKKNAKIPKETDPEKVTEKDAIELLKDGKAPAKRPRTRRTKATRKTKK